jgi:hypothetical protein
MDRRIFLKKSVLTIGAVNLLPDILKASGKEDNAFHYNISYLMISVVSKERVEASVFIDGIVDMNRFIPINERKIKCGEIIDFVHEYRGTNVDVAFDSSIINAGEIILPQNWIDAETLLLETTKFSELFDLREVYW